MTRSSGVFLNLNIFFWLSLVPLLGGLAGPKVRGPVGLALGGPADLALKGLLLGPSLVLCWVDTFAHFLVNAAKLDFYWVSIMELSYFDFDSGFCWGNGGVKDGDVPLGGLNGN